MSHTDIWNKFIRQFTSFFENTNYSPSCSLPSPQSPNCVIAVLNVSIWKPVQSLSQRVLHAYCAVTFRYDTSHTLHTSQVITCTAGCITGASKHINTPDRPQSAPFQNQASLLVRRHPLNLRLSSATCQCPRRTAFNTLVLMISTPRGPHAGMCRNASLL
jgi:hypothetical protein